MKYSCRRGHAFAGEGNLSAVTFPLRERSERRILSLVPRRGDKSVARTEPAMPDEGRSSPLRAELVGYLSSINIGGALALPWTMRRIISTHNFTLSEVQFFCARLDTQDNIFS